MRITTANYPESIGYPPFNDESWRFAVRIVGGAGRNLRLVEAYAEPTWSYDNVFVRFNNSSTRGYVHGAQSPSTVGLGQLSDDDTVAFTSGGSQGDGAFTFLVEIETGPGTGEYVPLTTSQVGGIEIIEVGESYAAATDYGGGPAPIACFWTDLTANLVQVCGETPAPDPDPDPPGGNDFVRSETHFSPGVDDNAYTRITAPNSPEDDPLYYSLVSPNAYWLYGNEFRVFAMPSDFDFYNSTFASIASSAIYEHHPVTQPTMNEFENNGDSTQFALSAPRFELPADVYFDVEQWVVTARINQSTFDGLPAGDPFYMAGPLIQWS